uniref:Terminase n=1 Tax=viral metagenome TaxID=1070528 RepID=A0A6M3IUW2_9ZZZZ
MPCIISRVKINKAKAEYIKSNGNGYKTLKAAGLAETTARHNVSPNNKLLKTVKAETAKELDNIGIVARLKRILALKLKLEESIFQDAVNDITLSREKKLQVINKTKDNIDLIIKNVRLLEGESTENININEAERAAKLSRIKSFLDTASTN